MAGSWLADSGTGFGIGNLPWGIFSTDDRPARPGVAIENYVVDVAEIFPADHFRAETLNPFLATGPDVWAETRTALTDLLTSASGRLVVEPHLIERSRIRMHLPFEVADYVDFYASEHHAANVGRILRPGSEPLPPAWRHLPIGYHGRAGTVLVSGSPIARPAGQRVVPGSTTVDFGATGRLDFEAEVGFVVGVASPVGQPVSATDFEKHVFGVVVVNDWSARDIQAFEYVPLGPFLGKSFATSISPWVVPLAALGTARVDGPAQEPEPLPHLRQAQPRGYDIHLEVSLNGTVISRPPFSTMYWSPAQMLAHMTSNGAGVRVGDLFASGTVSGPETGQSGSLIEISHGGTTPLILGDGTQRRFLEDGDSVTITAWAPGHLGPVSFGEVTGTVVSNG